MVRRGPLLVLAVLAGVALLWFGAGCVSKQRVVHVRQVAPVELEKIRDVRVVDRTGEEFFLSQVEIRGDSLLGTAAGGALVSLPLDRIAYLSYRDPKVHMSTAATVLTIVVLVPVAIFGMLLLICVLG